MVMVKRRHIVEMFLATQHDCRNGTQLSAPYVKHTAILLTRLHLDVSNIMCEFCNIPVDQNNRDALHPDFAGFFSAEAIEAVVRQANAASSSNEENDDDDDGT